MSSEPRFASHFDPDDATGVCVVWLAGVFDPEAVDGLHPQVQGLVRAGWRRFVFDLSGLTHLGSLGLRLLVGLAHQLKADGAVAVCELPDAVREMLELTKIDRVLRMYPSRAEAEDAVRRG